MFGPLRRRYLAWRVRRYTVAVERLEEVFGQVRSGGDVYLDLARQMDLAKPWELATLAMMRSADEKQIRAMELLLLARAARLTRYAVLVATLSVLVAAVAIATQMA